MPKLRLSPRPRLFLVVLGLLAFGNAIRGSFHFDDYSIFGSTIPWTTRPLTWLTFWVNDRLAGRNPLSWHAVDLLLHILCVLLFFECVRRFAGERTALLAAALFAIHPIQTEAVAYVFARATLLMTLFCLLSWLLWLQRHTWAAAALFLLAVLSKEECVFFPLFLLLLETLQYRRRTNWKPIAAMLLIAIAAGVNAIAATHSVRGSGAGFSAGIGPFDYALAEGPVICEYLVQIIFPFGFTIDPDIHPTQFSGAIGWLGILTVFLAGRHRPEWIWFAGGLVLLLASSSIFPAADLAADRRMYLPMIAFATGIAVLLSKAPGWLPICLALFLVPLSIARTEVWRTERSLWSHAVEEAPDKVRPRIQLSRALPPAEGLRLLQETENKHPNDPDIPAEMGRIDLQSGHPELAIAAFGRAAALRPNDAQSWSNLGVAFAMLHQDRAAAAQFRHALQLDSCLADARKNLHLEPCQSR